MQTDLNKLEGWAIISHMKLNNSKCWILYLRWSNPGYLFSLRDERLESSPDERDLRGFCLMAN